MNKWSLTKSNKMERKLLISLIFFSIPSFVFSQTLGWSLVSTCSDVSSDNSSTQWYVQSDDKTVFTLGGYGIKAYNYEDPANPQLILQNNESTETFKKARSICFKENLAYVATRQNTGGNKEQYVPDHRFRFEENIIDFNVNTGDFDYFINEGVVVAQDGEADMNFGARSIRFSAGNDAVTQNTAVLEKKCENAGQQSFSSLWIKVNSIGNSEILIPLRRNDEETILSITISPKSESQFYVTLANNVIENDLPLFNTNDWICLKVYADKDSSKLWWRTKECGEWLLIQEGKGVSNFNKLSIGVESRGDDGFEILMDDYYCHSSNIDEVSYVNGSLEVYGKEEFSRIKKYHSDIKLIQAKTIDDILVVSGLQGFNVYNIKDKNTPILTFTRRETSWVEYQGFDFFKNDGATYVVFSIYGGGISIWDITNPQSICRVAVQSLRKLNIENYDMTAGLFTFDLVVDYPYVYSTLSQNKKYLGTEKDIRGMIVFDITDLQNIKASLYPVNKEDWFQTITADPSPTDIRRFENLLFVNMAERGLGCYQIGGNGTLTYLGLISLFDGKPIKAFDISPDGYMFVSSYRGNTIYSLQKNHETTGGDGIEHLSPNNTNNKIYDLLGRTIKENSKGYRIVNGKKHIVK